jgi:hypothetical protein
MPTGVAVADFNGDGFDDLAVALTGTVSVLLGRGQGAFLPAVNYGVIEGTTPAYVAVGDFNGDGRPDLAVTSNYGPNLAILIGNGDGTFQPAVNYPISGSLATQAAVGDFNGDGKLDLAVGTTILSGDNYSVAIFLGNGNGTFQPPAYYPAANVPQFVAVGDFNRDGVQDLAVTGLGGVSILLGLGKGAFQAPVFYATTNGFPAGIAVGDLNGDGYADLAVANGFSSTTVAVLIGKGDGTFQPAVDYGTGPGPVSVVIRDFDLDGTLDLAVGSSGNLAILPGKGDGTFLPSVNFAIGSYPVSLATGYFNADRRPDLAVASESDSVAILLNTTIP